MKKAHNTDGVYQSGNLSLVSDEKEGMFIISIFPDKFSTLKESSKEITKEQLEALGFDVTPLYFDLNKHNIRADAESILIKNMAVLTKYPMLTIELVGNTDARASDNYNHELSKERADEVKKYLIKQGIDKVRIVKIDAKGKTQLVNKCIDNTCDESQHQLNRRVEFVISKK